VNSCFISNSWSNTSKGAFAGTCIGFVLVFIVALVRRLQREYESRPPAARRLPCATLSARTSVGAL
ncbi:uncharacterized protein BXZ73DRAFT_58716, partial [Epithele typhae]|uniref:uncharacterized protein n=1 Tax=Epithele typhae TaxID=378194 RepID=UPI002007CA7A